MRNQLSPNATFTATNIQVTGQVLVTQTLNSSTHDSDHGNELEIVDEFLKFLFLESIQDLGKEDVPRTTFLSTFDLLFKN